MIVQISRCEILGNTVIKFSRKRWLKCQHLCYVKFRLLFETTESVLCLSRFMTLYGIYAYAQCSLIVCDFKLWKEIVDFSLLILVVGKCHLVSTDRPFNGKRTLNYILISSLADSNNLCRGDESLWYRWLHLRCWRYKRSDSTRPWEASGSSTNRPYSCRVDWCQMRC